MRAVFLGTSPFAVPALRSLCAKHEVVLCITQPDRPQGRGLSLEPSAVKRAALELHVPVVQPERLSLADVVGVSADIGVVAAYGQLIRREVINHFPHGILGIHPSLLPKHRGAAPVAWSILSGESLTGVTIFRINEALDAGPLLIRREVAIEPHESLAMLTDRLAVLGAEETLRAVELIDSGQAVFTAQEDALATMAPKLLKTQGEVDWSKPASSIDCQIRALNPWPGVWTFWKAELLKIASAAVAGPGFPASGKPGSVVSCSDGHLIVATGEGLLELKEIQLPGKRKITGKEFISGYHVQTGDVLGV